MPLALRDVTSAERVAGSIATIAVTAANLANAGHGSAQSERILFDDERVIERAIPHVQTPVVRYTASQTSLGQRFARAVAAAGLDVAHEAGVLAGRFGVSHKKRAASQYADIATHLLNVIQFEFFSDYLSEIIV